jgi:hypothetical protein
MTHSSPRSNRIGVLSALWAAATITTAAHACGYHTGSAAGLTVAHASSLPVAMAIGTAVSAGRLQPLPEAPEPLALSRANAALRAFAHVVAAEPMPPIAVVLVEAHLWARVTGERGDASFVAHATGPEGAEVVVVTGEPVLRALLDGRIAWDDAVAAGLVVVDGPPPTRERLATLLGRRFSSSQAAARPDANPA